MDKQEFLKSESFADGTIILYANRFAAAEPYEEKFGKPLNLFTLEEIKEMYADMKATSTSYLFMTNHFFSRYADACGGENNYKKLSLADVTGFVDSNSILYSYNDIRLLRTWLPNYVDKFILASPYFGFSNKDDYIDYKGLTVDKFDVKTNTVHLIDRDLVVDDWLIYDALRAIDTYTVEANGITKGRLYGDEVIKFRNSMNTTEMKYSEYFRNKYARTIRKSVGDENITFSNIRTSGIINRAKSIMRVYKVNTVKELWKLEEFQKEVVQRFKLQPDQYYFHKYYGAFLSGES